jgi:DNA polymerase-3 subunit delta
MLEQIQQGTSIKDLYQKYRIWDKRKPLYQHALNNIRLENIAHAQSRLAQVDLLSKTTSYFNAFILLADVCVSLYHGDKTSQYSLDYEFA